MCYGVEVLLQKQLALLASSVHLAASSVHHSVLIQILLGCNSFFFFILIFLNLLPHVWPVVLCTYQSKGFLYCKVHSKWLIMVLLNNTKP